MTQKVTIKVKKRPKPPSGSDQPKRGPINLASPSKRPTRRRLQSGGIQFYDLGQIKTGDTYQDIAYAVAPNFNPSLGVDGSRTVLTFSDFQGLVNKVFEVPIGQWDNLYRKFSYEEAEKYGIDLYSYDNSKPYPIARDNSRYSLFTGDLVIDSTWTEQGLGVDGPISNFELLGHGAFIPILLNEERSEVKVTIEPSFESTEVEFSLAKTAKVFLMPNLNEMRAYSRQSPWTHEDGLFSPVKPLQRSFWLSATDTDGYPLLAFNPTVATADASTQLNVLQSARSGAIAFIHEISPDIISPANPSGIPQYPDNRMLQIDGQLRYDSGESMTAPEGMLIGVVKQSGQTFYLWAKQNTARGLTRFFELI